jgi:hypothetical protein
MGLHEITRRKLREQGYAWQDVMVLPMADFREGGRLQSGGEENITDRGFTIVVNMGDRDSDLKAGYAERTFKLLNPVYLLP